MAANTVPIFSKASDVQFGTTTLLTANTAIDGSGTTPAPQLVFTADATNGGYVVKVRFHPLGTNVATVIRLFINNGGTITTDGNTNLFAEVTAAATTVSQVAALTPLEIYLGFALPAGYKLYATVGTTVAAGFRVTTISGKY